MSASEAVRRKHVLVELIEERLTAKLMSHPRVANLPEMVLRHGVLQTAAFLRSKSRDNDKPTVDAELLALLEACVQKIAGSGLTPSTLAALGIEQYMVVNEAAIEASSWIALLAKARDGAPVVPETT